MDGMGIRSKTLLSYGLKEIVWKVLVASHRTLHSEKGHLVGDFNPSEKKYLKPPPSILKSCFDPENVFVPR